MRLETAIRIAERNYKRSWRHHGCNGSHGQSWHSPVTLLKTSLPATIACSGSEPAQPPFRVEGASKRAPRGSRCAVETSAERGPPGATCGALGAEEHLGAQWALGRYLGPERRSEQIRENFVGVHRRGRATIAAWRMLDPSSTPSATAITSRVLRLDQTAFDTSGFRQLGLRLPSLRPIFSMRRQIRVREHAGLQRPAEAWPAPSRSSRCQTARFAAWFRAARLVPATRLCVRVLLPFLFISAASPLPLSTLRWACARNLGVSSRSDPEPRGRRSAGRRTA